MLAMFIEENARIPSSPERGSFWETIFLERWENMHRIQRRSRLVFVGKNDSWCPYRGVNYESLTSPTTWISTEAGFWILWGEEATWPGSPTLLDTWLSARNYWYSSSVPPFHYVFQAFCLQKLLCLLRHGYQDGHHYFKGHEGPHVECTEHGVVENALDREWKGLYFRPGSASVVWGNSFVSQPPNTF